MDTSHVWPQWLLVNYLLSVETSMGTMVVEKDGCSQSRAPSCVETDKTMHE